MKKILVTGGCGFIGSHFIRYMLDQYPDLDIVNFDKRTYAGVNLVDFKHRGYEFVLGSIDNFQLVIDVIDGYKIDTIVNFAAESDNNKAVQSPLDFVHTNIVGTAVLLEAARLKNLGRFHHISTCEVYGELELESADKFTEKSKYDPRTPYNASKAAADHIVRSYYRTFNLPITISNCCNNYGSHQHPEKVIPNFITHTLQGKPMPVMASKHNKREWIHVSDHCRAIDLILHSGRIGETYNVGTGFEVSIEQLASLIIVYSLVFDSSIKIVPDRPGHDKRYLLDSIKITSELGWQPKIEFFNGLADTINWYHNNSTWWEPLLASSHSKY